MSANTKLCLSSLGKTWIFDIDGTLVKHNGYLIDGSDSLLGGVKQFFSSLPPVDRVILLTSRKREYAAETESFLKSNGIRFDHIIYDLPAGERILVNDEKPSGLRTAYALNKVRDESLEINYTIDPDL